jgi:dTMP kinase
MSEQALFITVEGSEGAGKTTALDFLEQTLHAAGIDVLRTREPGGTALGEELRRLLLAEREEGVDPIAELLMIFAARSQHLSETILPALASGRWVLCDRFTDATYAYQGAGRKLGYEAIAILEQLVQGTLRPDLTLLLDIPVETGLARARERGSLDRFEMEELAFFERVNACYRDLARQSSGRIRIVDAGRSLEDVQRDLARIVDEVLPSPPVRTEGALP